MHLEETINIYFEKYFLKLFQKVDLRFHLDFEFLVYWEYIFFFQEVFSFVNVLMLNLQNI